MINTMLFLSNETLCSYIRQKTSLHMSEIIDTLSRHTYEKAIPNPPFSLVTLRDGDIKQFILNITT